MSDSQPGGAPPKKRLRVLLVEDREDDALLTIRELVRAGYEIEHLRVQTAEELRKAISDALVSMGVLPLA